MLYTSRETECEGGLPREGELESIIERIEVVTGKDKKTVVMKYMELGRDEVATIDALASKMSRGKETDRRRTDLPDKH